MTTRDEIYATLCLQLLANDNETVGGSFNSPVPSLQGGQGQTVYVDGINGGDGGFVETSA